MPVSVDFRRFIEDQLGRIEPVDLRAMFGGVGVYARGIFFALVDDDVLYFKVDAALRERYRARGMEPFRPYGPDGAAMDGYWTVPAEVLEDREELGRWMAASLAVAATPRRTRRSR